MESYRLIPLAGKYGSGKEALVSAEDYEHLAAYRWFLSCYGYVVRSEISTQTIYMHRVVAKTPRIMHTDHLNHNRLDNRRENLRVCTHAENMRNSRGMLKASSAYKGVSAKRGRHKWRARIKVGGVERHLGHFPSEIDAALAYDAAAKQHFGEFAKTNF